jgi:2'-5' RNA ligase
MNEIPIATPERLQTRRLFFALWPEAETGRRLYELAGQMMRAGAGRRIVSENIHLTLAFLGSVTEADGVCYEQAASAVPGQAFDLTLDHLGGFQRSGILWVGPGLIPEALTGLVHALHQGLRACGYVPEERPFRAHLTLARNLRHGPEEQPVAPVVWNVRRFSLVQSHTDATGARYEVLQSWELKAGARDERRGTSE